MTLHTGRLQAVVQASAGIGVQATHAGHANT